MIITEILAAARVRLARAPFDPPGREAVLLLAHTLGWSEAQLIAHQNEALDTAVLRRFQAALDRRLTGEPVAYILGAKEFFGRMFEVDRRVLIPRPETEHLVEEALKISLPRSPTIADLGTGSGCLACTLALEITGSQVIATDISMAALAVAQRNLNRHQAHDRVQLIHTDLAGGIPLAEIDLVVSNPPYIGRDETDSISAEILDFEPAGALFAGAEGEIFHRRILEELGGLPTGSWLLIEIGAGQQALMSRLSADSPFELQELRTDYAGHPRVAVLRRR